ncbi:hypothetical protein Q9233_015904 [Columba guinea]|nr:hypothetical protein Q9233_015904 [Columba guinea]
MGSPELKLGSNENLMRTYLRGTFFGHCYGHSCDVWNMVESLYLRVLTYAFDTNEKVIQVEKLGPREVAVSAARKN